MPLLKNRDTVVPQSSLISQLLAKFDFFLVFFVTYFIYLLTSFPTVQTEDSGELIAAAVTLDIGHPPGYPLYVLVGKIFSLLVPFGNLAWRINIMSGFFAAATVTLLYLLIKKITKNDLLAMGSSFFLAFSNIFWSQAIRAEVYSLNSFLLALIIYFLYLWHDTEKNSWLYLAALTLGLGLTNHHLMIVAGPAIILFVFVRKWKVLLEPKTFFVSLLLFLLGLSVYAYLPIRTYLGPYDNPAFIDHSGIYTWEKFSAFVNRKIYGGTVHLTSPGTPEETTQEYLPVFLINIREFFMHYGYVFINNNRTAFIPLLKIITMEYFYFPLFFFLPGIYWLFQKNWRWAFFIIMMFVCYSAGLTMFINIYPDINSGANFGSRPFLTPILFILMIISALGFHLIQEKIPHKKTASALGLIFFLLPCIAIGANFHQNNESQNYIAYDYNRNLLESIPPNGYLLSTGRDNMTFPLYYLRKVEGLRPDVNLEIYYSSSPVTESFLRNKMISLKASAVFIDLVPINYEKIGLKPFGFAFALGQTSKISYHPPLTMKLRGVRKNMDYNNQRLAGLYYIKMGLQAEKDPQTRRFYFEKIIKELPKNINALNFIADYDRNHGDYDQAFRAYELAGNTEGTKDIEDRRKNPVNAAIKGYQSPLL